MTTDNVNHPAHYKTPTSEWMVAVRRRILGGDADPYKLECFEAMVSMLSIDELRGYLRGNSFKYRWRYYKKNGEEDLKKARWYEEKLLLLEQAVVEEFRNYA